jgi:hypothetical protein
MVTPDHVLVSLLVLLAVIYLVTRLFAKKKSNCRGMTMNRNSMRFQESRSK